MRSYRISTIAKLLCMSADAIRFFEKKKIIPPTRSPENNYRMYTLEDVRRLYDCCGFTAVGFSIREVEQNKAAVGCVDQFHALIAHIHGVPALE